MGIVIALMRKLQHRAYEDPLDCTFWICAFCNNQFAVEHAVGQRGVATSSFAVAMRCDSCKDVAVILDGGGEVYHRIWCAFELFFARQLQTARINGALNITLVNEEGVLSDGDASAESVLHMQVMMSRVHTANASASVDSDRVRICEEMTRQGVTFADLDAVLTNLAQSGVAAVNARKRAPLVCFVLCPIIG